VLERLQLPSVIQKRESERERAREREREGGRERGEGEGERGREGDQSAVLTSSLSLGPEGSESARVLRGAVGWNLTVSICTFVLVKQGTEAPRAWA
jgi:hypothetical protein